MASSAREEAERLVATVLAMAAAGGARERVAAGWGALGESVAGLVGAAHRPGSDRAADDAPSPGRSGWATGSEECCVCPVCRVIATMRDPSPDTAERLAAGAADLASGVTSLLRAFSAMAGERPRPSRPEPADPAATPDHPADAWSAATTADTTATDATIQAKAPRPRVAPHSMAAAQEQADPANHAAQERTGPENHAAQERTDPENHQDPWAAATTASAAQAQAEHAAAVRARAAQRAQALAAQRAAAKAAAEAASERAAQAAERVAQAVRAAEAERGEAADEPGTRRGPRTPRADVWAAATADAGVAQVAWPTAVDHDASGPPTPGERDSAAGDGALGGGAAGR